MPIEPLRSTESTRPLPDRVALERDRLRETRLERTELERADRARVDAQERRAQSDRVEAQRRSARDRQELIDEREQAQAQLIERDAERLLAARLQDARIDAERVRDRFETDRLRSERLRADEIERAQLNAEAAREAVDALVQREALEASALAERARFDALRAYESQRVASLPPPEGLEAAARLEAAVSARAQLDRVEAERIDRIDLSATARSNLPPGLPSPT